MDLLDKNAEYAKNKQLKAEDVKSLMEWVNQQPHLPKITESQALLFLHSCFFSNEQAKTCIDTYFTVKTLCPEIFCGRDPNQSPLKEGLDVVLFSVLPQKTPEGNSIIFMRFLDTNPDNYTFATQLKHFDMAVMQHLYKNGTSEGHLIVIDMDGVSFGHLTKLGPLTMKKFLYYLQEGMPLRLKGMHYFNIVSFMDKIMALMKPFMKKELLDVLFLHNDLEGLLKHVPRECLPKDYGGKADSIADLHEHVKTGLLQNGQLFAWEDGQKVDETQRPGKAKNVSDVFGVEGTFKKLELD